MSAPPEFSPMTESDIGWVVDNERELHVAPWTPGNFLDALSAGYSCWVMRVEGQRLAYGVMLIVLDEAHLLNLSVVRPMHRAGIGSSLLRFLLDEARRCGAMQFFLEVRPSNAPALALYRSHGFVSIGRRKHYYPPVDGKREDGVVMRLEL